MRAIALLALLGAGCSSTVPLSSHHRSTIRSVHLAEDIPMAGSISGSLPSVPVETRGETWYMHWITAPVGAAVDVVHWSSNQRRESLALRGRLEREGVDLEAMVRRSFLRSLESAQVFRVQNWGGDAELRLEVEYGLDDGYGVRGGWHPSLALTGRLFDSGGELLWQERASIPSDDPRSPEYYSDPFLEPERLRKGYHRLARLAAEELVAKLKRS